MANRVLDSVMRKCRSAMAGRIPIVYIKTDSDIFIRKIVENEENPLVVLLSNGGEGDNDLLRNRPLYEMADAGDRQLKYCLNYRNAVPEMKRDGRCADLYASAPKLKTDSICIGPVIWTCRMPEDEKELTLLYRRIESYIISHEDSRNPDYGILQSCILILYSSAVHVSPLMRNYTEFIEVAYPDEEEIRTIIKNETAGDSVLTGNEAYLSALCSDFLGFTEEEIIMTIQRILTSTSFDDSGKVEGIIADRKKQKMEGGILEFCRSDSEIGGWERFREWLRNQVSPLKNAYYYMRKTGITPPKGVLLCGIPGCGKSEAARFTANTLGMPLLKMDIGSLMDKYQGVSEQRMRDALKMAESMSPCVLWIDELEKGFSAAGSEGDSSSFKRMFGYMLGWMQDNEKPCFIVATANDIGGLPKEFFRSGRFDALYAVYLPTAGECAGIFQVHMRKAEKRVAGYSSSDDWHGRLFADECYNDSFYQRFMEEELVLKDGKPRIIIGSDIQKMVNTALRLISGLGEADLISAQRWEDALRQTVNGNSFVVYGDGEENIDSIAVGYCRMLRKGFIPTADDVLFQSRDYHIENLTRYEQMQKNPPRTDNANGGGMDVPTLEKYEILQDNGCVFQNQYDGAVYAYLKQRINSIAVPLEKREREMMIRR